MSRKIAFVLFALACGGWDTKLYEDIHGGAHWTSVYEPPDDAAYAQLLTAAGEVDPAALAGGNEHAEIANISMLQLGWGPMMYGQLPTVLDLNASVWNPKVRDAPDELEADDNEGTPLIERRIPHPARFSGIGDISYTMYDWINRNLECPPLPESAPHFDGCHVHREWLGAALNSSHFGEQPRKMYQRLHGVALALGAQAARMHAAYDRNELEADKPQIEAMIREAELEALAYEAYAQHFLQDRWAAGHMWSRYGSPEYDGTGASFEAQQAVGLYSGLIHGAEAVFSMQHTITTWIPDALSSPQMEDNVGADVAYPVSYFEGTAKIPAVGDYRLEDAYDGMFGAEYGYDDAAIDVHHQIASMLVCSHAGFGDVALTFGANPAGGYGILGLPVVNQPTYDATYTRASRGNESVECFGQWATNASMAVAVNDPMKPNLYDLLDEVASGTMSWQIAGIAGGYLKIDFAQFGKVFLDTEHFGNLAPSGHDVADGTKLPTVMGIQQGNAYLDQVPASYIEPEPAAGEDPFSALPMDVQGWDLPSAGDRVGRDRHTLQGYFHQAHAGAWCEAAHDTLVYDASLPFDDPEQGLRWPVPVSPDLETPTGELADELARRADACVVLADRLFSRTYAWYKDEVYLGPQREFRRLDHGGTLAGNAMPACEVLESVPPSAVGSASWKDNPYELHPGYVHTPYETVPFYGDKVYESIVSWCRAVPVVDVDDDDVAVDGAGVAIAVHPGFRDDGTLSFDASVRTPQITLHGRNFGTAQGQVMLESESGCVTDPPVSKFAPIVAWGEEAITIEVPHTRFVPDHYRITIIRADRGPDNLRVRSVGRARLDVQRAAFGDVGSTTAPLPTDILGQQFAALFPFCAGGNVTSQRITDCTGVDETACGSDGGPGTLLWADGNPAGYQPGPFAAHQWGVQQTAICSALPGWVTCMPEYPNSYGFLYRVERTSTAPVTDTPKRWRFTLIWQRPGPF